MRKKVKAPNPILVRLVIGVVLVSSVVGVYLFCDVRETRVTDTRNLGPPPRWDLSNMELWVLFFANLERSDRDRHPLLYDRTLSEAARWQARYNEKEGRLIHYTTIPGMETTGDRIRQYRGGEPVHWGENLAVIYQLDMAGKRFLQRQKKGVSFRDFGDLEISWRTETGAARRIVSSWMSSPPHREGLLQPDFYRAGVAVVTGTYRTEKAFYAAQVFSDDRPGLTLENFAYRKLPSDRPGYRKFFLKIFNRPGLEPVVFGYGSSERIVRLSYIEYRDGYLFDVPPDDEHDMIYRYGAFDTYKGIYYPMGRVSWSADQYP